MKLREASDDYIMQQSKFRNAGITSRLVMGKLQASLPSPQTRRVYPPCDFCGRLQVATLSDEGMALSVSGVFTRLQAQLRVLKNGCRDLKHVAAPNIRTCVFHSRLSLILNYFMPGVL